jgi:hypothetical protein
MELMVKRGLKKMAKTSAKLKGKRCQCPSCKEVFSAASGFDKHRKGEHGKNRHCVDPESVGMVVSVRGDNSYWVTPLPDNVVFSR